MLYCVGRRFSPSKTGVSHACASISYDPLSHDLSSSQEKAKQSKICTTQNSIQSTRKGTARWQQCSRAQGQRKHTNQQKQVGIQTRTPPPVSCLSSSKSPIPMISDVRSNLSSSPLVEEPARALVRALGRALLGLHPVGEARESRHAGSLTGCAGVGSTTAAKRLSDATEWVVGEVGLRGSGT